MRHWIKNFAVRSQALDTDWSTFGGWPVEERDEAYPMISRSQTSLLQHEFWQAMLPAGCWCSYFNKNWSRNQVCQSAEPARYLKHTWRNITEEPDLIQNAMRGYSYCQLISKAIFATNLFGLVQQEFITETEFDESCKKREDLWLIRHHLHKIAQTQWKPCFIWLSAPDCWAHRLPWQFASQCRSWAVYARLLPLCQRQISTLSEMLTQQHYYERWLRRVNDEQRPMHKVINERFKLVGDRIAVTHTRVFAQHPTAI